MKQSPRYSEQEIRQMVEMNACSPNLFRRKELGLYAYYLALHHGCSRAFAKKAQRVWGK